MTARGTSRPAARSPYVLARAVVAAALAAVAGLAFGPMFLPFGTDPVTEPAFAWPVLGAVAIAAGVPILLAVATRAAPVTRLAAGLAALGVEVALVVACAGRPRCCPPPRR
jgi:hypothetical protein